MKISILAMIAFSAISLTFAGTHVNGYTKKNGTYVAPYERTSPNSTKNDNYSTKGNYNPYTGTAGTKPRDEDYNNTNNNGNSNTTTNSNSNTNSKNNSIPQNNNSYTSY